ncbi:MAG: C40 family peptidase [Nitrospirae bacterium]|nr:C40 family peptidase [Nitrospirota bacterium]
MKEKLILLIVLILVCAVSGQSFASKSSSAPKNAVSAVSEEQPIKLQTESGQGDQQQSGFFKKMQKNVFSYLQQNVPFISTVYIGMGYRSSSNPDTTGESDCSNLVNAITRNSLIGTDYEFVPDGISSRDLRDNCHKVSYNELRPGDLIFFAKGRKHRIYHVGVITKVLFGAVHFVHASSGSGVVETVSGSETWHHYWGKKFHSFGRWKPEVFVKKSNT